MTKSINLKIIMESEEALAYYHMEYRDEVWFSMRESYPAIKEAALRWVKECSAEKEFDLKDIDEDLSGVVINQADEISTVVICTYEDGNIHIKEWISDSKEQFHLDSEAVVKGLMTAVMEDNVREFNNLYLEGSGIKAHPLFRMLSL